MRVIPPALRDFAKGTQSRAFPCPTHFGGRGTERGLPAAGRDLLFVEQSSLVTARSGRPLFLGGHLLPFLLPSLRPPRLRGNLSLFPPPLPPRAKPQPPAHPRLESRVILSFRRNPRGPCSPPSRQSKFRSAQGAPEWALNFRNCSAGCAAAKFSPRSSSSALSPSAS